MMAWNYRIVNGHLAEVYYDSEGNITGWRSPAIYNPLDSEEDLRECHVWDTRHTGESYEEWKDNLWKEWQGAMNKASNQPSLELPEDE